MGDAPPPRLAPLGRPTLITDLPTDVLSYIISLVRKYLKMRVRLSVVCRAFADAVRPLSAVWADVDILFTGKHAGWGVCEQYNTPSLQGAHGTLERALQVAGPSVRRFTFEVYTFDNKEDRYPTRAWAERVLAAAPRVRRVELDSIVVVEGPLPMVWAGRAAILDFWIDYLFHRSSFSSPPQDYWYAVLALHRRLVAAGRQAGGVAAQTVPMLTSVEHLELRAGYLRPFIRSLTAGGEQHLTRLHLSETAGSLMMFDVPAFLDHLPALRELHVRRKHPLCHYGMPLDLRRVVTPPRGLTCLTVDSETHGTALLPPAIMARLEVMGFSGVHGPGPPDCLRDAGNSFRRLTRLACRPQGGCPTDLACWATPEFAVPTLIVLEVGGYYTLGAADGPAWAATVASTTLPRLERLVLFTGRVGPPRFDGNRLMDADAVAEAITHSLPAAAAAAGRSLSVCVQRRDYGVFDTISRQVNPQCGFEKFSNTHIFPDRSLVALTYEARPVR